MELILWRHAEAEDGVPDAARALTRKGHKQAERMAQWLLPRLGDDWRILVSPARRTLETAEALGREFEVSEAIGTGSNSERLLREAGWPAGEANVLVVGHQPTLGQVAAMLLGGRGDVSVRKGAAWWFAVRDRGAGHEVIVRAVMNPDLAD